MYNLYYKLGQCYVTFLSFFLFKNKKIFVSQFIKLLTHKGNILTVLKKGPRFYVRSFSDLMIIRSVFGDEIYKPLFTDLKQDSTLIDIGAYIGDSAIYAAHFPKVNKIIALEPLADNVKFLKKNLEENGVKKVLVLEKAVSVKSGRRNIYIYKQEDIASFIKSENSKKAVNIATITLADVIQLVKTKELLLKCDIEGEEYELFLKTPTKTLSKINRLMIELHLSNLKDKNLLEKLLLHLKSAGFKCRIKKSFFNPKYPLLYGSIK